MMIIMIVIIFHKINNKNNAFLPPAWLGRTYDAVLVIITIKVVSVYTSI